MTEKMKNILIGLFVATSISLIVLMILFLDPRVGDGKKTLGVRFANISGIMVGTRVTFAGKPIGEVVSIQEIQHARSIPADDAGKIYFYELTLKIDSSVDVYSFDEIAIRTTGLMGEKSIAIIPKAAPIGKTATLVTNQIISANSIDPLENAFQQVAKVSNRMDTSLNHIDDWFVKNQQNLTQTTEALHRTLTQVTALLQSVEQNALVPSLAQGVSLLNDNLAFIKSSFADDQLLYKTSALVESMHSAVNTLNTDGAYALQNINRIAQNLSSGSGTLGRFLTNDDFYLRLSSLLSKGETLMNDVNHYGLLFQYDKHWQRSRTKKANLLKSLDTPKEFRSYFEGEVDSITTSLGRLTELLDLAGTERNKVIENSSFKQQFSQLLRSVQSLSDSLRLYNEGLIADSE